MLALAVLAAATSLPPMPSAQPEESSGLFISGAHVLSSSNDAWLEGRVVTVFKGRITEIAPREQIAEVHGPHVDGKDLYLIPGLIDLHTHLLLHPYDETTWNDQVLKESLELRTIRATVAARKTVEAGFTTIRELGTEGAAFADVALRDAIDAGLITGPRLFVSTRAIVATASYGPAGFDPRWQVPIGAQEVTGPDAMRLAVRQQVAAGADWVKLYADYHRTPRDQTTPTLSVEELRAAVDEAHAAGKPVAVHATTDDGIRRAVEAGVTTIEHGYGATRATLELMKAKGVVLCPTMAAAEAVSRYAGWKPDQPPPPAVVKSRESFRLARDVGVTIANGSDAGVFAHGENYREIELMVAAGMPAPEALRAATSVAAKVLGKETELGRLDKGFLADIVAVRADPLADPAALEHVVLVISRGRVVLDKR